MNKYEWSIYISGSKMHPVEVYGGSFVYMDGREKNFRSLGGGARMFTGYWSSPGNTMNSTKEFPLPTELSVAWFSYTEAKFYGGNFELPYDKILCLFKNEELKTIRGDKLFKEKYRNFRVGFAPGGLVVIWASGSGYVKEVAHFKAEEVQIDLKELSPTTRRTSISDYAQYYLSEFSYIDDYLSEHSLDSEIALFERYMARYNTGFKVAFVDNTKNKISSFNVQFANGERLPFFPEDQVFSERGNYASMKYFEVDWIHFNSNGGREELQANVCIKKEEFLRIYDQAWGSDHSKAVDVIVNIAKDNKGIEIYLTDGVNRYDFDMEFVQAAGYNYTTEKLLFRTDNYNGRKDEKFTWDNYSD